MNILNLLTKKRNVVGIEISDQSIKIAYLRPKHKKENTKDSYPFELILKEEPLPYNVVSYGVIVDKGTLSASLKKIWNNESLNKSYAVVSIQEDKTYSHVLSFPNDIDKNKLKEAVSLAIDFQIPIKRDDFYVGWEQNNDSSESNKVLVSAISKDIANEYIQVLDYVGINVLALESHIASISRSAKLNTKEKVLITKENQNSVTIFCFKNNVFQFTRTIPKSFAKNEESIKKEQTKLKNSFESESKEPISEVNLNDTKIVDEYSKYINTEELENQAKWLIPIGAFIRGEIPQGKDSQISLLPVGTAEAYSYQKIKIFVTLVRNIIIGVSLFFLFAFIASYLFILSISQRINSSNNKVVIAPTSSDITVKESLIKKVNSFGFISESILQNTPSWSILIDEINNRTIDGIIISNFRAQSINEAMSIAGISTNRDILNQFKKSLQDSKYLTEVELPITNLEQKGDIPFSISFKIKDPSMLYYK